MDATKKEELMQQRYPVAKETLRRYRLWDTWEKADVPHRYYRWINNAHDAALRIAAWSKIGRVVEVYDASNGRLIGQYVRKVKGVEFIRVRYER